MILFPKKQRNSTDLESLFCKREKNILILPDIKRIEGGDLSRPLLFKLDLLETQNRTFELNGIQFGTINIPMTCTLYQEANPHEGSFYRGFLNPERGISSLIRGRARFHLSFLLIFAKLQARSRIRLSGTKLLQEIGHPVCIPAIRVTYPHAAHTHTHTHTGVSCLRERKPSRQTLTPATGYIMQKIADERNLGKMRIGIEEGSKSGYQNNVVKSYPPSRVCVYVIREFGAVIIT